MLRQHGSFLFTDDVPKGAIYELVNFEGKKNWIRWYLHDWSDNGNIDLPAGQYSIVGLCKDLTEAMWMDIVEADSNEYGAGYYDYCDSPDPFYSAKDSGFSLLLSLGFEPGQNVLAIKIEK